MNKYIKYLILTLYTLLLVCMGFATVIDKVGSDSSFSSSASTSIYSSWWFVSLWALLAVVSLLYLLQHNVHKRYAVMILHLSFAVILAGAFITHLFAESGKVHLRQGEDVALFVSDDGEYINMPFTLTMTRFSVINYPGTDAVMDYCCEMVVSPHKDTLTVSMNNIGKVSGYRFYQSAYDSDGQGSQLLVSHDPYGIAVTYIGYVLLLVSLLWTLFSKNTRIRQLYRLATKPLLVLFFCLTASVHAHAVHGEATHVNPDIADRFAEVSVLYNGRICPLNTAAIEFVTKLSGKSSWQSYSANEIFLSWMIYYTEWERQPIILIKDSEVQRILGIEGRWASVQDFYTSGHKYKLSYKVYDPSLPASTRKAVREADEKLQVVSMFYNSEMLHIFPLTVSGKFDWYTPGSTELPLGTPEAEFQFINHVMDQLTQCILVNDVHGATQLISKIKLYQKEKAASCLPSALTLRMEIIYNSLLQARYLVYLYLTLSILLCLLTLMRRDDRKVGITHNVFLILSFLWITSLFVMRWWVSGHVPVSNGFETMLFMSWVTILVSLLSVRFQPILKSLAPVVSAFCMLVATIAVGSPQITNLMPVLQSPLLSIHVALVMVSYALFAIITLIAIYNLILFRLQRTAELESMTALSALLLYPAVFLLAVGIFVGAVWANVSWGNYWSWDPKETWALITLMVYAIPLHRSFISFTPLKFNVYLILSFLAVLMTYFGVNYLLGGMHSYA